MQYVMCIKYAPSDPTIAYFGVDSTRVWKSEDGGFTWHNVKGEGFFSHGCRSLAVDPVNPQVVFAAGFGGYHPSAGINYTNLLSGIYRTENGGLSWELVRKTDFFKQHGLGDLIVFDSGSSLASQTPVVYAGSYNEGLLRSDNGGGTWKVVDFSNEHIRDLKEDPSKPGTLFVLTDSGLHSYPRNKENPLGGGLPETPLTVSVSTKPEGVVYAALGSKGIYRSTDHGQHFQKASKGLKPIDYPYVACSPVDGSIVYTKAHQSAYKPLYSIDEAQTWALSENTNERGLSLSNGQWFASPVAPHPAVARVALMGCNGKARILKTSNGGRTWEYSGNGYMGGRARRIRFVGDDPNVFMLALNDHGIWYTDNGGNTFKEIITPRVFGLQSVDWVSAAGKNLVASIGAWGKQALALSKNFGKTWTVLSDKTVEGTLKGCVQYHPRNSSVIYAGEYRSDDGGGSWKKLTRIIYAVHPRNGDIVYSIGRDKNGRAVISKSLDKGDTWESPYSTAPTSVGGISDIEVAPDDPDRIYLATYSGVAIYNNQFWTKKGAGSGLSPDYFGNVAVYTITVDYNRPNLVYAGRHSAGFGHGNGVFLSNDRGETWHDITGNLGPALTVFEISIQPVSGRPFIGTSLGTWKLKGTIPPPKLKIIQRKIKEK